MDGVSTDCCDGKGEAAIAGGGARLILGLWVIIRVRGQASIARGGGGCTRVTFRPGCSHVRGIALPIQTVFANGSCEHCLRCTMQQQAVASGDVMGREG